MVLGSYYLTYRPLRKRREPAATTTTSAVQRDLLACKPSELRRGAATCTSRLRDEDEAMLACKDHLIGAHQPIRVRVDKAMRRHDGATSIVDDDASAASSSTSNIPQDLGFVERVTTALHRALLRATRSTFTVRQEAAGQDRRPHASRKHGFTVAAEVLDNIKAPGLPLLHHRRHHRLHRGYDHPRREVRRSSPRPSSAVVDIETQYKHGLHDRRASATALVVAEWEKTTNDVTDALQENMDQLQPHLHDGGLRRPWLHEPDPSAGRYARPDGQHRRPDHRDPHQGKLPRGPVRAGILHLLPRRP